MFCERFAGQPGVRQNPLSHQRLDNQPHRRARTGGIALQKIRFESRLQRLLQAPHCGNLPDPNMFEHVMGEIRYRQRHLTAQDLLPGPDPLARAQYSVESTNRD